jgi:hypothetical protein
VIVKSNPLLNLKDFFPFSPDGGDYSSLLPYSGHCPALFCPAAPDMCKGEQMNTSGDPNRAMKDRAYEVLKTK